VQLGLGNASASERDPRSADVDPGGRRERAGVEREAQEPAGAAAGIEQALTRPGEVIPQQGRADLAHAAVPPVRELDRVDAGVVVGRDARGERIGGRDTHAATAVATGRPARSSRASSMAAK
jgi:hypothetical protein